MSRTLVAIAVMTAVAALLGSCQTGRGGPRFINRMGVHELDRELELRVLARGMTLVEYQIRLRDTREVLGSDVCGRDGSRWFFYYDDSKRLWVYSDDIKAEVWIPDRTGDLRKQRVFRGSHYALNMPEPVVRHIPPRTRRQLGIAAVTE